YFYSITGLTSCLALANKYTSAVNGVPFSIVVGELLE
ncbi:unnamed protein product, partial [marine sediment metagenome]